MTDIQRLLHLNVEIEGLLRVLDTRDSAESRILLMQKFEQFTALMATTFSKEKSSDYERTEPVQLAKVGATASVAEPLGNPEVKNQESEIAEIEPEEDAAEAAIERGFAEHKADAPQVTEGDMLQRPTIDIEAKHVAHVQPAKEDTLQTEQKQVSVTRPVTRNLETKPAAEPKPVIEMKPQHKSSTTFQTPAPVQSSANKKKEPIAISKAFTLNDRFRFRRELFNSNDSDFTETLNLISEMDSYSEAEDYLIHDLMWNPENPSVVDFLNIISRCLPNG